MMTACLVAVILVLMVICAVQVFMIKSLTKEAVRTIELVTVESGLAIKALMKEMEKR
jgi:hypothetical protein